MGPRPILVIPFPVRPIRQTSLTPALTVGKAQKPKSPFVQGPFRYEKLVAGACYVPSCTLDRPADERATPSLGPRIL